MKGIPVSFFVDVGTVEDDALDWTRFLLVVVVRLFGCDVVGALLLRERVLCVDVRFWRWVFLVFFFLFRHGRGLGRVGERGVEVDGKSRARADLERGESNVRTQKDGDEMNKHAGVIVRPVVLGDGAVEAGVLVRQWGVVVRSRGECLSRGVIVW